MKDLGVDTSHFMSTVEAADMTRAKLEEGEWSDEPATYNQRAYLERLGVSPRSTLTKGEASKLIDETLTKQKSEEAERTKALLDKLADQAERLIASLGRIGWAKFARAHRMSPDTFALAVQALVKKERLTEIQALEAMSDYKAAPPPSRIQDAKRWLLRRLGLMP